jgi:type I restriction enzyme, S subunit
MKWEYKTLDQLGTVSRGKSKHRPRNDPKLFGGKYPFIQTADVKNADYYITKYSDTYNESGLAQSKLWDKGTLCITIAANIADTGVLAFPACFPDSIMGFVPFEGVANTRFIKYCFDRLQRDCKQISQGTAQDNLSWEKLSTIKFCIPEYKEQCRIADILSAYDDLIENNQKQIKLLEEAAQRLYKEWFVDLRFPGHENTKIVDDVPEGWSRTNINEILTFHRGYDLTKNEMKAGRYPVVGSTTVIGYHNEFKIKGPGIVTGRSGSLGKYQFIWDNFWPHNTSLYISDYKDHNIFFVYSLLQTVDFASLNNGGAIPTLNRNVLSNIEVIEPEKKLQDVFAKIAEPQYQKIRNLEKQNDRLKTARDLLLPKLMSGEVEV